MANQKDRPNLINRLCQYQSERVPIIVLGIMSSLTVGVLYHFSHAPMIRYIISVVIIMLYLIQIRASDEEKDYEHDNHFYKNRPVQRGLVTLKELGKINKSTIAMQLLLYVSFLDLRIFLLGLLSQSYAFLTRKEFFVRRWIREHFWIYSFAHNIQLIILFFAIINIIQPTGRSYEQLLLLVVLNIAVLEIGRKTLPAEKDIAKDTYSYHLGYKGIAFSLIFALILNLSFAAFLVAGGVYLYLSAWLLLPVATSIATATLAVRYGINPDSKNQKRMEGGVLLTFVASMLSVILGAGF